MTCRACKSTKVEPMFDLGEQYLSEFRKDDKKPKKYPLELMLCTECTLLQLRNTVPSNELYGDGYGYYSGINNTIREDLKDVVLEVAKRTEGTITKDDIVVDIGSNDATLLKNYKPGITRVGFDLVPKFAKHYNEGGLIFVNEPFSFKTFNKLFPGKKAKVITSISMFFGKGLLYIQP